MNGATAHLSATRDLARLRAPGGRGVYASTGELFSSALFGRDSLEVAEDLMDIRPELALEIVLAIARLQGTRDVAAGPRSTEEMRGRIHHEWRARIIDGVEVSERSRELLVELSRRWCGDADGMTYYASIDATPLFVRVVDRLAARLGDDVVLGAQYVDREGRRVTLRDAALAATEFVEARIAESSASGPGLYEYSRRNPAGIEYQGWCDGRASLVHPARKGGPQTGALPEQRPYEECGELADPDQPIAQVETQGLAYDALIAAARLTDDPAAAARYRREAHELRDRVLASFWVPQRRYFAVAVDRDDVGNPRRVVTTSSNAAELLNTGIFDDLPAAQRSRYVNAIVRTVMSPAVLTDAGVRTVSLRDSGQLGYAGYHGSFTVWHKQTWDVACGLRRQGFPLLATQLENRIVATVNAQGGHLEYVYVDGLGRACLDPRNSRRLPQPEVIAATNIPDDCQAWTASAVMAIKWRRGHRVPDVRSRDPGIRRLEADLLHRIRRVAVPRTRDAGRRAFEVSPPFVVDRDLGARRESDFVRNWEAEHRGGGTRTLSA